MFSFCYLIKYLLIYQLQVELFWGGGYPCEYLTSLGIDIFHFDKTCHNFRKFCCDCKKIKIPTDSLKVILVSPLGTCHCLTPNQKIFIIFSAAAK